MFTATHSRRAHALALAVLALIVASLAASAPAAVDPELLEGRAPTVEELQPSVEAAFAHQSYRPDTRATLVVSDRAHGIVLRLFRVGPGDTPTVGRDEMQGVPVSSNQRVGSSDGRLSLHVAIGHWPTGLYFARLTADDGRVGFAPFVLRPRTLGEHRVAIVLPTLTWQAYNLRDDDGNGVGNSWYANWHIDTVRLARPFLNRGVPYSFRGYDYRFLRWMALTGHTADYLSDADLYGASSARALARAYDLVIFPGHHEYVTTREYGLVKGYRDLGGNLAFLSANNFFWQTARHGDTIVRTKQWRDLGQPEAALVGVQYRASDGGAHRGPWIVRDAEAAPWLFDGTGLTDGSAFGNGGIEIDSTTPASPPGLKVLAEIPDLFGHGLTAQMTYYETPAGARVFAAGAFTLAGEALDAGPMSRLLANLWAHLAMP